MKMNDFTGFGEETKAKLIEENNRVIEDIKTMRRDLDGLISDLKTINVKSVIHSFKEEEVDVLIRRSKEQVTRARQWLGVYLEELGTTNPYPESVDPSNKRIAPAADKTKNRKTTNTGDCIIDLKTHRVYLQTLIDTFRLKIEKNSVSLEQVYISLIDAKMLLGEALGWIRDLQKS